MDQRWTYGRIFFMVGLELKRELIEGELSDRRNIVLPGVGALGGILFPAMIYIYFNSGDSVAMKGWAKSGESGYLAAVLSWRKAVYTAYTRLTLSGHGITERIQPVDVNFHGGSRPNG